MPEETFELGPFLADPGTDQALSMMDSLVRWLTSSGVLIVVILVAATAASMVASWLLRRFFRTMADSGTKLSSVAGSVVKRDARAQKAAQARREQRAETLSSVARNVAHLIIWAVALVMILDKIGVNIAPVIASLGVIGLAAGIGAQTIIKDVVAGIVMLFEDIIAVGDYVDLEYAEGTVVGINLRVTQVRGVDGVLWTVRNGEIVRTGNYSRGFSNAVVVLDIDAGADDRAVTDVLTTVTEQLAKDPDWTDVLQSAASISGMLDMDGNRYQRRVIIQTAPGEQWGVERELRGRVRAAFTDAGIGFALPRFTEAVQS
ncbi:MULTISPECIES: mechanosensitive ion channel family protein [Brachybacterium]|uniref:Mechanosensitive ion channel protein MscS n=1 Tax=Brachybacterium alimentarium TaxID=47845 RepID=A0A2A3YHN4_9MICO|nr:MULTISPECIES: mechanosensitive ion channel family protein [Brachybacterium]PCC34995.1 mechanosensitive ion channel protein MscS [Brachybacterium alimentarium]PCC38781.1 mechanosensitive ion channel protein MscS [Brachybacterium alimentarium]RCS64992.1 mechanosensitive ion channel family protein [Brachybacterium sp. JB7]RCS68840.1 mechanosensitive ion channel family protein [Brachybacterium alimentarium]RCS80357.1 mechanosensitive ion channel family protein [Brachybacterium alimentarium]